MTKNKFYLRIETSFNIVRSTRISETVAHIFFRPVMRLIIRLSGILFHSKNNLSVPEITTDALVLVALFIYVADVLDRI